MSSSDLASGLKKQVKHFLKASRKALWCTSNPEWMTISDYIVQADKDEWISVEEPYDESHYSATQYGIKSVDFYKHTSKIIPELGILRLNNAMLVGQHGWVVTDNGVFLPEQSWFGVHISELTNNMSFPRFIAKDEVVAGKTLSLASDYACNVYGHYVIDSFARLSLFFKAGFTFDDIDHIYCPQPLKGHGEVLFSELGIPKEKCIWANQNKTFQFETLLSPSFPGLRRNYPPWVVDFFRDKLNLDYSKKPTRRLYVTRKGFVRNFAGEEKFESFLHSQGFETYNPVHHVNSHRDFAEAEMVIGISGSALTGLAFCRPGTKVLEVLSEDHLYPYYFTMANAGNMEFNYIVGSPEKSHSSTFGPSQSDIHVDFDVFKSTVMSILNS